MAKDVEELLKHVGWLSDSEGDITRLNVVGVSMGGMIALELVRGLALLPHPPLFSVCIASLLLSSRYQALLIPQQIRTLLLTSTKAGSSSLPDIPSYASLRMFGLLTTGMVKTPEDQVALVAETLFPKEYLDEVIEEEGERKGKKRREMVEAVSAFVILDFDFV